MKIEDNLVAWRALLTTYTTRNFSQTAIQMDLDTPKVSRLIAGLESELGMSLFDKTRRPMVPTESCVTVVQMLEPAVKAFQEIKNYTEGITKKTFIKVAAPIDLGQLFISDQLFRYSQQHPNVQFSIHPQVTEDKVLSGEIDVALMNHYPLSKTYKIL